MSTQQQQMYRLQQAQRLQQQRLFSQQQTQQPQGQGQGQQVSLSTIDPSLLTLQYAKDEFQDPTDPFSLSNDYDMMSPGQAQHQQGQGHSILSPLSTSPLDAPEYEGMDDLTPHGSGSLSNSPYGTPALHQYYSMSVPVRGPAGFHHPSSHGIPVQQAPSSSLIPSGASGSSFQSSFNSGIGVMHGEESSLKQCVVGFIS
jgi:hypothetical protein